jgi:hypothetical protein
MQRDYLNSGQVQAQCRYRKLSAVIQTSQGVSLVTKALALRILKNTAVQRFQLDLKHVG